LQVEHEHREELDTLIMEACSNYVFEIDPSIVNGHSGMNNTTRVIRDRAAQYSLRLYNNHQDENKLLFEHAVLTQLGQRNLVISIPQPVMNKKHSTITKLHNDKLAAMFEFIEGERPTLQAMSHIEGLGKAAGILSCALAELQTEYMPAYTPYYELATNYDPLTEAWKESFFASSDLLHEHEEEIRFIQLERVKLEELASSLSKLPQQWIHGDINCSNSLCVGDEIVAILDFEFVTRDVRAMELAVLLAELIKPSTDQLHSKLQLMKEAFLQSQPLTATELGYLTELIKLRLVDVAMHFFHRYQDGLDKANVLVSIITNTVYGLSWLSAHPL